MKKGLLYLEIASVMALEIEKGVYREGEKILSLRALARRFNCTVETALKAYVELEKKGLLFAKARSGFVVAKKMNSIELKLEAINLENLRAHEVLGHLLKIEGKREVIGFGTALRTPHLFPLKKIYSQVTGANKVFQELDSHYSYPPGPEGLRLQIAKRLSARGMSATKEQILICAGATEAIFLSLLLTTKTGDNVLVHSPCFFGSLNSMAALGLNVFEVMGEDLNEIEKIIKKENIKVLIVQANFQQSTGTSFSEKLKKGLVEICAHHNVKIIEDDAYGELNHTGNLISNLRKHDKNNIVFSCGTFSKTLGPGLRLGWIYADDKLIEELVVLKLATTYSSSAHTEKAVELFLKNNSYQRHLSRMNRILAGNIKIIRSSLVKSLPDFVKISNPKGGFSLWINFDSRLDSFELYKKLMKENIAVSPGHIFTTGKKYRNEIRINCGLEMTKEVKRALQRMIDIINEMLS